MLRVVRLLVPVLLGVWTKTVSMLVDAQPGNRNLVQNDYWYGGRDFAQSNVFQTRIAGGVDTEEGRFPYFVALQKRNQFVCGGTLIASNVVLTAAHCGTELTHAIVGKYSKDDNDTEEEEIEVEEMYAHPDFNYDSGSFDQMIVELKTSSTKPYIGDVNIHSTVPQANMDEIAIIGLGRISYQGSSPNVLQKATVVAISNEECAMSKGEQYDYANRIRLSNICVVGQNQGQCNGDSGGPYLLLGNSYEDDVVIGLVSWGAQCSETGAPGVGSRLSASDFIRTQTCDIAADPQPPLCGGTGVETPQTTTLPSTAPSSVPTTSFPSTEPSSIVEQQPSLNPSDRNCIDIFDACSSNEECCDLNCAMGPGSVGLCRPKQSSVAKGLSRLSGTRGGAAGIQKGLGV